MTTKAQEIAEQLTPYFKTCETWGGKYNDARRKAYAKGEEARRAETWAKKEPLYEELQTLENIEQSNRANLKKALEVLARNIGELCAPYWRELRERKGWETLAEIINEKNTAKEYTPRSISVHFSHDGGKICDDATAYEFIKISLYVGGAVGVDYHFTQYCNDKAKTGELKAFKPHTVAQYAKAINEAKKCQKEAEELARKCTELLRNIGALDVVEHFYIKKTY